MPLPPGIFNPFAEPEKDKETFRDVYERSFPDTVLEIGIPPPQVEWKSPRCTIRVLDIPPESLIDTIVCVVKEFSATCRLRLLRNGISYTSPEDMRLPKPQESMLQSETGAVYVFSGDEHAAKEDAALLRLCTTLRGLPQATKIFKKYKVSVILTS